MLHAQTVLDRIESSGVTLYRLSKETGISQSLFSKWKKNPDTFITSQNLVLIADYLGCSIDYLLGRDEDRFPDKSASIPFRPTGQLKELVDVYSSLDSIQQNSLLTFAKFLAAGGALPSSTEEMLAEAK